MARSYFVVGLGFGDEGKGTMVDFLVRRTGALLVVRFVGGSQPAHHVVTDEGLTHLSGLSRLRELRLENTQVTIAGIEELRSHLPHCHVPPVTVADW